MGVASSCGANTPAMVVPTYTEEADEKSLIQRHKVLNEIKKPKKLTIPDDKTEELSPSTPLLAYKKYVPKRNKRKKKYPTFKIYHPDGEITSV